MKNLVKLIILCLISGAVFAETVNIAALKGPTGLSMVNLIDKNSQLNQEKTIEYSIINTPDLVVSGLLSNSIDIAALPTNLAAIVFNKKPDYLLAATTGDGTLYVVSSRTDIKSWADLKGKKVYNIARSSTPGFLFNFLITKNSLNPERDLDIDFTYDHVQLAPMLIAGKVETGVLPEPLVTSVLLKNPLMKVVLDFQDEYLNKTNSKASYPLSCIVIKKDLIENNPKLVNQFLIELEESINWVKTNPKLAGEMGEKVGLGVTGPLIVKAMPRLNLNYKRAVDVQLELTNYYNILFNSDPKSVGGKLPNQDFYMSLKK